MTEETDEIVAADSALAHAMARLLKAIDVVGDDGEACRHVSPTMAEELEHLAARLSAAQGFAG